MLIALWGPSSDSPLECVHRELNRRGASVLLLDVPRTGPIDVSLEVSSSELLGTICTGARRVDVNSVQSWYARPDGSRSAPSDSARAIAVDDALWSILELSRGLVVNRPSAMSPNSSKPFQLAQIQSHGFRVPETIVTNDRQAVRAFWATHGTVIYKSTSGMRSIVSRLSVGHESRLDDVSTCPTQFQRWIAGRDVRVHVVGCLAFASEIESSSDDYRFAPSDDDPIIRPIALPFDVEEACIRMVQAMGLHLAGIDLRRTPDNEWYCFEVNPSPAFPYYEQWTNQPIASTLAQLLMSGTGLAPSDYVCS